MGREPLSLRIAPLTSLPCDSVVLCGISNRFRLLSPSKRQVAHALLTRSPLSKIPKNFAPFDLHVLGTPPAFVLSQDQTLEFNLLTPLSVLLTFFRLVVFLFASVILDLSIRIDLACLLMHYIVFKVLFAPPFCGTASLVYLTSLALSTLIFHFFSSFFSASFAPRSSNAAYITPLSSHCQPLFSSFFRN